MNPGQELVFRIFRNHLVFENISGYLDLKDLHSFRCAHSVFNEASLPAVLKRDTVVRLTDSRNIQLLYPKDEHLHNQSQLLNGGHFLKPGETELFALKRGIEALTNLLNQSSGFPCSKFVLGSDVFNQKLGSNLHLDNYLNAISRFATELELRKGWMDRSFYCKAPTLSAQFEQLKALKIFFVRYLDGSLTMEDRNRDLALFSNIFSHSPNLSTLHLDSGDEQEFLSMCLEALQGSQWQKIRNLSLTGIIKSQYFIKLQQFGVKLKCLSVCFLAAVNNSPHGTIPMSFLESQSSTLEQLTLEWPTWVGLDINCELGFPCMSKVKKLNVLCFQRNIQFPELCFVEQFPALKHLSFFKHFDKSKDFFLNKVQPLNTVTTLELLDHGVVTPMALELVEQACRVFPNVKTLRISGHLNLLKSVNTHLTNVTEIIISYEKDDGLLQALTGYTKAELDMQKTLKKDIREIVPHDPEPLPIFERIRVLRLRDVIVNDFMCENGLLKLTGLKSLDLMKAAQISRISDSVLAKMRQQFEVHLNSDWITAT